VKNDTLLLAIGGAGLAFYFWKHPTTPAKAINGGVTANGAPAPGGATTIAPNVNIRSGGTGSGGLLGSGVQIGDIAKLFGSVKSLFAGTGSNEASTPAKTYEPGNSNFDFFAGAPPNTDPSQPLKYFEPGGPPQVYYGPGGAPPVEETPVTKPDPNAGDNSPDFERGNSVDVLDFA